MLHYKTFAAWVAVDDVELEQYGVEVLEEENKVTCWIASEAGKQFVVKWRGVDIVDGTMLHDQNRGISSAITVDGVSCGGKFRPPLNVAEITLDAVVISATSVRPFLFSHLNLTDDENYLHATHKGLGEIQLDLWDAIKVGECYTPNNDVRTGEEKVHERSKKAMTHCVKFGEGRLLANPTSVRTGYLNTKPFATFIFKYRAAAMLKANGIIPTRAGEKRPADEEPTIEIIDEEVHDVKNEQEDGPGYDEYSQQIEAMKEKVKELEEKRSKAKSRPTKKVKTEFRPSKLFQPGEVIDLT